MCTDPWWPHDVASDATCGGECAESPHGTRETARCVASESTPEAVDSQASEAARSGNSETASNPQLEATERQAPVSVPTSDVDVVRKAQLRLHAIELLAAHRAAVDRDMAARPHVITLARGYGVTWREISEALGVPESTARAQATAGGE